MTSALSLRASWSIARRDLNAGIRGLRLLFICLFLGVATLAAISSLTASITGELSARGQTILGGDIEARMMQREASPDEKTALRQLGAMSETIRLRAMAHAEARGDSDGAGAVLTELKGVDGAYPLYGALTLRGGAYRALPADQIIIAEALAERLRISAGDQLRYGAATFTIADVITDEPDRVGEGFTLGPVAIVSLEGLRRTELIQPGSLYESKYRLRIAPGTDVETLSKRLDEQYAEAGWSFRDRDRAAPGMSRFFERMGQFLTLIGLTALVIAGIGVSNGVSSYLALKRGGIATLKVLGATSADIERIYLMQIGTIAAVAIGFGLVAGALLPPALVALLGDILPVRPGFQIHPVPLLTSAAYGLLIAFIFTLPPLARARTLPVAAILRSLIDPRVMPDKRSLSGAVLATAALLAIALGTAREPLFSAAVLGATLAVLGLLMGLGWAISWVAKRVPRPRRPLWRLAIANLYRPGAQTTALVIALGLALTLFVTLAGVQTSLTAEIDRTVPKKAPSQFVLDIPSAQEAQFRAIVARQVPDAQLNVVPALRGRIVAYGGQRVADLETIPEGAWFLRGERGVTYSATLPEGSELTAGKWWTPDYAGPPLISLDEEAAKTLDLGIGDRMTVSVLGREIEVTIASLRKVNWDSMGFNYVMVFSPSALASAPHSLTATITMDPKHGPAVTHALLAAFPGISVIAVSEVIEQISGLLEQMSGAIVAAASIAIFAGIAVLIGAITASRQARSYDSVILKTLGATRWQILGTQALEYALLAATLALVSLALGMGAAWYVIVKVFDFGWAPDWGIVLATLAGGALLTLGIGLAGSIPLMSLRPSRALREL